MANPTSPGVSVVIPAYNYARFLARAVQSALDQTFTDHEVIVVDDGSTDNTAELVKTFTDPRVRYVFQQNAGLSAARNRGIVEARAPLVALLDADDEWTNEHLAESVAAFAQLDASFAVVASNSFQIDVESTPLPTRDRENFGDREIRAADIVMKSRFMPSSAVVKRDVFELCGNFDTTLRSSEDRDMWIRIGEKRRIFWRQHATVRIRKHGSNMSKHADRMRTSMRTVIRSARARRVVAPRWPIFWAKVWAVFYFQNAWTYFDAGRRNDALAEIVASFAAWPLPLSSKGLDEPTFFRLRALARFLWHFRVRETPPPP